ncbi:hypothetical protein RFI_10516 [Reticulomyxa filosa]|uniref:Nuclear pore protein n=1 Tax=Reticulomyxa filosa TaxID=46433 RepID=X6NMJ3_RETFI|nr:hypothetical protein RFI_10516 [Reticulomyxa filosa]|eukprot:ETO26622.1 hypothetical protein RFI_10516 [Reticulomyxa filosa]
MKSLDFGRREKEKKMNELTLLNDNTIHFTVNNGNEARGGEGKEEEEEEEELGGGIVGTIEKRGIGKDAEMDMFLSGVSNFDESILFSLQRQDASVKKKKKAKDDGTSPSSFASEYKVWEIRFAQVIEKISKGRSLRHFANDVDVASMMNTNIATTTTTTTTTTMTTAATNGLIFLQFLATHNELMKKEQATRALTADEIQQLHSLSDLWNCATLMMHEQPIQGLFQQLKDECLLRPYEFYPAYFGNDMKLKIGLQRYLQMGTLQYFSRMFAKQMMLEVDNAPNVSGIGGQLSNEALVIAFVRNREKNGSFDHLSEYHRVTLKSSEELPLYPLIYYAIRMGDLQLAIDFASLDEKEQF